MRIAVFGASGRTGRRLVERALAAGHNVTAFVRNRSKLETTHERLRIAEGDITDPERVSEAVKGQDAVLVALGPGCDAPPETLTHGIHHIINAMQEHGVRRVIAISGAGIHVPGDRKRLFDKIASSIVRLVNRRDVLEKEEQYRLFQQSGLDWTLVRPPVLSEGPPTGSYKTDAQRLEGKPKVSRGDLADFMLQELENGRYNQQTVFLGG